jgi:hypothetical protein
MHVFLIVGIYRNSSEIRTLILNAHFGHRHGASRINANFLLNSEDLLRSVKDLHELFFYTEATRRVF